jgi:ribosome maturation factor RimP
MLRPAVESLGYDLVGLEYHPGGAGMLRVYIECAEGITVRDCARVSHQVSGVLDVEDPIASAYTLEVSSPGVFRPLFGAEDYQRFAGERVRVKLVAEHAGRRQLRGVLLGCEGGQVSVQADGESYSVPLGLIAKANLDPEL